LQGLGKEQELIIQRNKVSGLQQKATRPASYRRPSGSPTLETSIKRTDFSFYLLESREYAQYGQNEEFVKSLASTKRTDI
jgi:hypothetical protein